MPGSRPVAGAIAAMLLTAPQAAVAQVPLRSTSESPLYPAQALALGGVRLDMNPAETAAAFRGAGYTRHRQTEGPGWDARVSYLLLVDRGSASPVVGGSSPARIM